MSELPRGSTLRIIRGAVWDFTSGFRQMPKDSLLVKDHEALDRFYKSIDDFERYITKQIEEE